jgi:hypothetical protein
MATARIRREYMLEAATIIKVSTREAALFPLSRETHRSTYVSTAAHGNAAEDGFNVFAESVVRNSVH